MSRRRIRGLTWGTRIVGRPGHEREIRTIAAWSALSPPFVKMLARQHGPADEQFEAALKRLEPCASPPPLT